MKFPDIWCSDQVGEKRNSWETTGRANLYNRGVHEVERWNWGRDCCEKGVYEQRELENLLSVLHPQGGFPRLGRE